VSVYTRLTFAAVFLIFLILLVCLLPFFLAIFPSVSISPEFFISVLPFHHSFFLFSFYSRLLPLFYLPVLLSFCLRYAYCLSFFAFSPSSFYYYVRGLTCLIHCFMYFVSDFHAREFFLYMLTYTCVCTGVCMYVCMYVFMYVFLYVCMYVCSYVQYVCMYAQCVCTVCMYVM